jgi:hypothetical protein
MARLANISGKQAVKTFKKFSWHVVGQVGSHVVMTKSGMKTGDGAWECGNVAKSGIGIGGCDKNQICIQAAFTMTWSGKRLRRETGMASRSSRYNFKRIGNLGVFSAMSFSFMRRIERRTKKYKKGKCFQMF